MKNTGKNTGKDATNGRFKPGNQIAKGNPGGGRPLDLFKAKCREIADREQLGEWLVSVKNGDIKSYSVTTKKIAGGTTEVQDRTEYISTKDQIRATELLKEWGYGKEEPNVQVNIGINMGQMFSVLRQERGMPAPGTNGHGKNGHGQP